LLSIIEYLEGDSRPGIGHLRPDLTDADGRFWPVFKYLVIYRPDTKPLEIVRVLHGRRDVERILVD
jgi:antitoxin ParD1/3/4/toxin ParE1/3/4